MQLSLLDRHEHYAAIRRKVMEQEGRAGFARLADMACTRCRARHGLNPDSRCHANADPFESDCPPLTELLDAYGCAPHLKPSARAVLNVLADGRVHSALSFKRGEYGFTVDAVSQRVSELVAAGYPVVNVKKDGGVASYRLVR